MSGTKDALFRTKDAPKTTMLMLAARLSIIQRSHIIVSFKASAEITRRRKTYFIGYFTDTILGSIKK